MMQKVRNLQYPPVKVFLELFKLLGPNLSHESDLCVYGVLGVLTSQGRVKALNRTSVNINHSIPALKAD